MRLTDEELTEAFEYAHGSLRLTAALSELRERRKRDLTTEEREALKFAHDFIVEEGGNHGRWERAAAVLSKLLGQGGKP
jgi:hypothetical protein